MASDIIRADRTAKAEEGQGDFASDMGVPCQETSERFVSRYDRWQTLPGMFFEQAAAGGQRPFLWHKQAGAWQSLSWAEVADRVARLTAGLSRLGVRAGDRVMLVSENRPEWLIADVAIMTAGAITVPAYTTNTPEDHRHVLDDSGARAIIVSTPDLCARVCEAVAKSALDPAIVLIDHEAAEPEIGPGIVAWRELLSEPAPSPVPEGLSEARRDDTACIIYTSGTGGAPKGVMLSHGAILCNCKSACDLIADLGVENNVFLSFLPLSHSYEHSAGQFFPMSIQAEIYYAESIEALPRNMAEVRPTIMTAVPRLYETMHQRIRHGLRRESSLKRKLFLKAVELGRRAYEDPGSLGMLDRLANAALDRLVRDKVRARFGGRIKALVSGGAPLNYEIGVFFSALGLRLLQGYGQTEAAPVVSCNRPGRVRIETVGPPLLGVDVRIADDGEILVRGELVMQGYWNNPEATALALRDGWLHTGDIGEIDPDGYIRITDRKKDIIVNSGGDTLAPQRIEGFLALQPEIAQAMVYGDRRPYLVAVIVPDPDFVKEWARRNGARPDLAALAEDDRFRRAVGEVVDRVGERLSVIERVRRFIVAPEPFDIGNGMMTPSMKIRRHMIQARYGDRLEALY